VSQKAGTIHVKWIRSGIGFSHRQKEMLWSLGLRRLNQVIERPDTAQIRGLVANLSHLVEVVAAPSKPAWRSIPEYNILAPEGSGKAEKAPASPVTGTREETAEARVGSQPSIPGEAVAAKATTGEEGKAATTDRRAAKARSANPTEEKAAKAKQAKTSERKKEGRAAGSSKESKPPKKGKK
jgi:large subunit ribosomal protein L30